LEIDMQTNTTRTHLSLIPRVALAIGFAIAVAPTTHAQGLSYDIKTSGTMEDPRSGTTTTRTFMNAHGQFAHGVSRLDVTESLSPGGMMGTGTYMITNTGKGTTTMVDPAKRTYLELNPAELAKSMAGLQQAVGGMARTEVSDVSVNVEELGAGESMEGYATLKYRITESYTMSMSIMGMSTRSTTHSTTDLWIAPKLDGIMNPTARPAPTAATGPMAELTEQLTKAYAKVRTGLMLKRVATIESERKGKTNTSTMTMIVSNVKRAPISPSVFEVPAGYTKTESPFDAMGALGDSINAAKVRGGKKGGVGTLGEALDSAKAGTKQGAVDGAKDESKDDAKAQAKKVLGRMFGRPQ
jgi:hypothetical protein